MLRHPAPCVTSTWPLLNPQVVLPEAEWQSSATRLGLQLMSAGARAVYQAQLPLQLVASLDLGCVASVAPSARQRTLGEGFALKELQVGG
jgi:DNA polymerase epsilon subunit 1